MKKFNTDQEQILEIVKRLYFLTDKIENFFLAFTRTGTIHQTSKSGEEPGLSKKNADPDTKNLFDD